MKRTEEEEKKIALSLKDQNCLYLQISQIVNHKFIIMYVL
jgi:hypothetical protein